jgi:hypothetical protein
MKVPGTCEDRFPVRVYFGFSMSTSRTHLPYLSRFLFFPFSFSLALRISFFPSSHFPLIAFSISSHSPSLLVLPERHRFLRRATCSSFVEKPRALRPPTFPWIRTSRLHRPCTRTGQQAFVPPAWILAHAQPACPSLWFLSGAHLPLLIQHPNGPAPGDIHLQFQRQRQCTSPVDLPQPRGHHPLTKTRGPQPVRVSSTLAYPKSLGTSASHCRPRTPGTLPDLPSTPTTSITPCWLGVACA